MYKSIYCTFIFSLAASSCTFAQDFLAGKIFKNASAEIIAGVNITNTRSKQYNHSDGGGNYRIAASSGDTMIFSSAGYRPDTVIVNYAMLINGYNVFLVANVVALPSVEIDALSKYEADSARRHQDYAFILDKKHPVKLWNEKRDADAPGLNFSPVGFFSKNERQKRRLKQRLKQEVEDDKKAYVDARFSQAHVARLTRLKGDSLQLFMLRFRPSFEVCRNLGSQDLLLYINERLILFKNGKRKK